MARLAVRLKAKQSEILFRAKQTQPILEARLPVVISLQFLSVPQGESIKIDYTMPVFIQ